VTNKRSALRPRYLKLHALLVYAFLFAPIVVLVVFSFNHARSGTKFTGVSTRWYDDLIHNADALKAFRNTLKVGSPRHSSPPCWDVGRVRAHPVQVPGPGWILDTRVRVARDAEIVLAISSSPSSVEFAGGGSGCGP